MIPIHFDILGGGGFFTPFVHVDKGGGDVKCPRLSTRGGEGVKIGQNLVHVVVECPLSKNIMFYAFLVVRILGWFPSYIYSWSIGHILEHGFFC